jgi:hypothetical protein
MRQISICCCSKIYAIQQLRTNFNQKYTYVEVRFTTYRDVASIKPPRLPIVENAMNIGVSHDRLTGKTLSLNVLNG